MNHYPLLQADMDWLELRLTLAVHDINQEYRMSSSHITGLADIVRQTRSVLADLPAVADEMKSTAAEVMANVAQVKSLTDELKSANVELKGAIGQLGNGAPPLETTTDSAPVIPAPLPTVDAIHDDTGALSRPTLSV
ncbi:hypothetical protein [Bradyrhizobium sp. 62]|uniref:hypothetical protein n=1 Tax=Bradyrhizobium sp. 62 TaxID=1043588 RepID=UPI001FF8F169|nr:hypothetical protein [Bradyrhizobium sp. 62]MCK1367627.1 hypothetical protein [Bradyrhizobium sp. 62]